jgi:hypothetical protein
MKLSKCHVFLLLLSLTPLGAEGRKDPACVQTCGYILSDCNGYCNRAPPGIDRGDCYDDCSGSFKSCVAVCRDVSLHLKVPTAKVECNG